MTSAAAIAADELVSAAARLRGATEALNVLGCRSTADQQRASVFAVGMLSSAVPADWSVAGLPQPLPASHPGQAAGVGFPVGHRAVLLLARAAMVLHTAGLRVCERPAHWERLARIFAAHLPGSDPDLFRLRERALIARVTAGDTSTAVFAGLAGAVDFHRAVHGEDAYLTSIATTNLALAFRQRREEGDLATSAALAEEAVRARAASYGAEHPLTLVARSLLAVSLLLQAEASTEPARRRLASRVLGEITQVRAARMRLYGSTAPNTTVSRRYEALALLLLGEPERARQTLELTLAFETAHSGTGRAKAIADTRLLLAEVYRALGDTGRALEQAREASRLYGLHKPGGHGARRARRLAEELASAEMPRTRSA